MHDDPEISRYFVSTVSKGARVCYRMTAAKYIKELVET